MGKGNLRNKECLCGSGARYKRCCYDLTDGQVEEKKQTIVMSKVFRDANIKKCLFPDNSQCDERIIRAHSIQNNKILDRLSENGEVYMIRPRYGYNFGFVLEKVGRAKATTFTGFCAHHDNKIFSPIDNMPYIVGDSQQEALYAYKAFAREWHAKLVVMNVMRLAEDKIIDPSSKDELEAFSEGVALALADIEKDAVIFRDFLLGGQDDEIATKVIVFNNEYDFSVSAAITMPFDFEGNRLEHFAKTEWLFAKTLFLSIFPQDGKTYILLSYLKRESSFFSFLDDQLLKTNDDVKKDRLTKLVVYHCENSAFSPRLIEAMTETEKTKLVEAFHSTVHVFQSDIPMQDSAGFSLFG